MGSIVIKAGFKIVQCMTLLHRAAKKKKMTLSSSRSPWRRGNGKYIVTNLHSSSEAGAMDGSHHRLPTVLQSLDHGLTSPGDLLQLEEEYGRRGNRNSGKSEGWGQRRVERRREGEGYCICVEKLDHDASQALRHICGSRLWAGLREGKIEGEVKGEE